jgi:hypothetical protein
MRTVEDRLHDLSTTPAPTPPALEDLRARARVRRRHRTSTAAGVLAVLVALAVLAWSTLAGTDATTDVVAGPTADEPTSDPLDRARLPLDDPVRLAYQALQYYGNDEPPAAVRLGRVDTSTFRDWQRQHTGGSGPAWPDTVTVLLVRTSGGGLSAPRPPAGSSGQLRGDTVYVVFTEGPSPDVTGSGTGTWSEMIAGSGTGTWPEIVASSWADELEEIEVG